MIVTNEYFDGKIKSIGTESGGQRFTVGIIEPGEYTFPTEDEEHVTITHGKCMVKVSGAEWCDVKIGDSFTAPANSELSFKVVNPIAYICLYK